jgi:hypothetical protein
VEKINIQNKGSEIIRNGSLKIIDLRVRKLREETK